MTKKRNRLGVATLGKLTSIHNNLVLSENNDFEWKTDILNWNEEVINTSIEKSRKIQVKDFTNYLEEDEDYYITTKDNDSMLKLDSKYKGVCFHDEDSNETRMVVGIEWNKRSKRGHYQLVTKLISNSNNVEYEPYLINDEFFKMVSN